MRFVVLVAAAAAGLLSQQVQAIVPRQNFQGFSVPEALSAIDDIGKLSDQTRILFERVRNDSNTQVIPRTLNNLQQITTSALTTNLRVQEANRPDYPQEDQESICGTFDSFLETSQSLQEAIINAKSVVASTQFLAPVASISRIVPITLDNLIFSVAGLVPHCAWQFAESQKSLDNTLNQVTQIYQLPQSRKK